MTALIVVLPLIVVVEISLQLHQSFWVMLIRFMTALKRCFDLSSMQMTESEIAKYDGRWSWLSSIVLHSIFVKTLRTWQEELVCWQRWDKSLPKLQRNMTSQYGVHPHLSFILMCTTIFCFSLCTVAGFSVW
jgi:hypothetical protein